MNEPLFTAKKMCFLTCMLGYIIQPCTLHNWCGMSSKWKEKNEMYWSILGAVVSSCVLQKTLQKFTKSIELYLMRCYV